MEAPTPAPVALAASQKRPFEEDDAAPQVSTPTRAISSTTSSPLTVFSSIDTPSPFKIVPTVASTGSDKSAIPNQDAPAPSDTPQPAKRRKVTAQEKEEQRLEKEAKAKERAEKKVQKEAQDKIKAEQKAGREDKKREKELKQQQEEDEKQKKERSQMRLNAFFTKPKPAGDPPGKQTVELVQIPPSGPTSLAPEIALSSTNSAPPSPQKTIRKNAQSDYERFFLPFSLPPQAILAPYNAFLGDSKRLVAAKTRMHKLIAQEDIEMEPVTLETFRAIFPKRRRGLTTATVAEVVDLVNGSADKPIDLTESGSGSVKLPQPLEYLKQIPMKYLHFPQDVRPPYYGTYTKPHTCTEERRLARNPISRALPELNYDYDSEAEWEEPEEGEDLDEDDEEDLDEDGDEEMDGFLDDEEDPQLKRRLMNGDQEPVSTGLCWEDSCGVPRLNDGSGAISTEFKEFRLSFLLEPQPQSIDPFSTAYWIPELPVVSKSTQSTMKDATSGLMNPPRLPLASRPVNGLLNTLSPSQNRPSEASAKAVKPKRMIPTDQLSAFKTEIDGQDLTKIGMIEALKKKFPKLPKDAITNTLSAVAKRIGPSEKEKRWVLIA